MTVEGGGSGGKSNRPPYLNHLSTMQLRLRPAWRKQPILKATQINEHSDGDVFDRSAC